MSTPAQSLWQSGGRCCDGRDPVPLYVFLSPFGGAAKMRETLRQSGIDGDEPWCHSCATVLENIRDGFEAGGATFLRLVATVAAFVPGIGTGIAAALSGAAALAEGKNITEAMHDAAIGAVPGGSAVEAAGRAGEAIIQGKGLDEAALAGARSLTVSQFGKAAGVAFDTIVAVTQGKALQDAGFAALRKYVPGAALVEQAAAFADAVGVASRGGRDVSEVLLDRLAGELADVARRPEYNRVVTDNRTAAALMPVMAAIQRDPSLRLQPSERLAFALNVPEPLARAARILVTPSGTVDAALLERLAPTPTEDFAEVYRPIVSRTAIADWNTEKEIVALHELAPARSTAAAPTVFHIEPQAAAPIAIVAAPTTPAPVKRSSTGQDVLLGVTIATALGALYWWATSGRPA